MPSHSCLRRALAAAGAVAAIAFVAPTQARAQLPEPLTLSCPPTGCVVTVGAGVAGAMAHFGKGVINTGAAAGASLLEGVVGPGGTFVGSSIGKHTTARQGTFLFIGQAGDAGQRTDVSTGGGDTAAGVSAHRYNLIFGEDAFAGVSSADHTTAAAAGGSFSYGLAYAATGTGVSAGPGGLIARAIMSFFLPLLGEDQVGVVLSTGRDGTTLTTFVPD